MMISVRISQFKLVLIFTLALGSAVSAYVIWIVVEFNSRHAVAESQVLSKYTERVISRYNANPQKFATLSDAELARVLGSGHVNLIFGYAQLRQKFNFIPDENKFQNRQIKAVVVNYRGLLRTPTYLLVFPTHLKNGENFYSYLGNL